MDSRELVVYGINLTTIEKRRGDGEKEIVCLFPPSSNSAIVMKQVDPIDSFENVRLFIQPID